MNAAAEHPVWEVYDLFRTARLNVHYYEKKLTSYEFANTMFDILIAVFTPTSAVAGFFFFKDDTGKEVLGILCTVASLLAIVKPFLKLPEKIKQIESSLTTYRIMDYDLDIMRKLIRESGEYTATHKGIFDEIEKRKKDLKVNPPKIRKDDKLRDTLVGVVVTELPKESFFIPEER